MSLELRSSAKGLSFRVRLKPRSSRDALLGVRDGVLHAAVTRPPVGGRANKALVELLAAEFGLPKKAFSIASGAASREKTVLVDPAFAGRFKKALAERGAG
ncbi:MAG: hypothetical protein DRP90_00320 [Planctomycetota bacterium]|nr:MAG: hypothetical protein DRP90_00320 [Planctomycetota bacterium]